MIDDYPAAGQAISPAGKQATHCDTGAAGAAAHGTVGAGLIRLTVTVTVVFTNAYVVKVEETTN